MSNQCANCKKTYALSEQDMDILLKGGHIHIVCKCHQENGLNILVAGTKKSDPLVPFGATMELIYTKPKSANGRKIIEEENPPVRILKKKGGMSS